MKFRLVHVLLIGCLGLMVGCDSTDKIDSGQSPVDGIHPDSFTFLKFDLASGNPAKFPLPNDVLRNPATGRLAFPSFGSPAVQALIAQVNTLNGFSTSSFIRIPFDGDVNHATVNNSTVLVIDMVALQQSPTTPANFLRPMVFTWDTDETGATVLKATPVRPLRPGRPHMVVITGNVKNAAGLSIESDTAMLALKSTATLTGTGAALEPLRQVYNANLWPAAEAVTQTKRLFIPGVFAFTTQTLHAGINSMYELAQLEPATPHVTLAAVGTANVDAVFTQLGQSAVPHNAIGAFATGTINMPNYISHPVTGFIQSLENPTRQDINYIATLPLAPSPFGDGTYPVIIYQHGITSRKETILALANSAALGGFATIGIDLALHGQRSIDANGDGQIDPSGATFINLTNLLLSRDNVRQSVSDLMVLTRMISSGAGDITGDGHNDLSSAAITFTGMSLGGIVGGTFVSSEPHVGAAVLNVAGGRVPNLLLNSASFGPTIKAGLAQFGLVEHTSLFDIYFMFAQAIFDDADPINYVGHASSGALSDGVPTRIMIQEMMGDGVVPNVATADLARALNGAQVDAIEVISGLTQVQSPHYGSGIYQFTTPADPGTAHSALLNPASGNPTAAIQTQVLTFLGTALLGNPTIANPFPAKDEIDIYRGMDAPVDVTQMNFFPNVK